MYQFPFKRSLYTSGEGNSGKIVWMGAIGVDKSGYRVNIFLIPPQKNICCGYSLEVPWQGTSNEKCLGKALLMSTHNMCFCREIRKI